MRAVSQFPDASTVIALCGGPHGNFAAVGFDERDCGCGYHDPHDRAFAQLSRMGVAGTCAAHSELPWIRAIARVGLLDHLRGDPAAA